MAVAYAIAISMDGGDKAWIHKKKRALVGDEIGKGPIKMLKAWHLSRPRKLLQTDKCLLG